MTKPGQHRRDASMPGAIVTRRALRSPWGVITTPTMLRPRRSPARLLLLARPLVLAGALAAPLVFSGCKQQEDERCEIDTDCSEGLVCLTLSAGGMPVTTPGLLPMSAPTHKTCRPRGSAVPSAQAEAGVPMDAPAFEGSLPEAPVERPPADSGPEASPVDSGVELGQQTPADAGPDVGRDAVDGPSAG